MTLPPWGWWGHQSWNVMVGMTVWPSVPMVPQSCQSPAPASPRHRSAHHTWCRVGGGPQEGRPPRPRPRGQH